MSNDNKCEGFSNLNCFSIISKFKSLFGSKLIEAGDFGKDNKLSDSLTSSPSAFAFGFHQHSLEHFCLRVWAGLVPQLLKHFLDSLRSS
jgi:hypothetical protein